jgi:translation elongation factor EF-1alpha
MRKKHKIISGTSIRLSAHEKICAERMAQLIKTIDELKVEVKDLRGDMNKGKGVIYFVLFLGTIATALASFFQFKS